MRRLVYTLDNSRANSVELLLQKHHDVIQKILRKALSAIGHRVCLIAPDYGKDGDDDADIIRIPSRYLVLDPEYRIL